MARIIRITGIVILVTFNVLIFSSISSEGESASENYAITTSVISGGGAPTGSSNFHANSTLEQPSPLKHPFDPPLSLNFILEPGFWYTVKAIFASECEGDFEPDGDVDGADLAELVANPALLDLSTFAAEFGRTDCPTSD